MVDSSIISLVKKRNNAAFKQLYQTCIRYVFSIVRRYITNSSDHQDVIQEIFARVFLSINTFDQSKGDFKFWLRRLVINQCLQHYRQRKSPILFVPLDTINEADNSVEEQLTKLTKAEIEVHLQKMPIGYRQVFMLVVIDDFSHKEVGALLDITEETSRSQLSRAKKWLQKNILENNQKNLTSGIKLR